MLSSWNSFPCSGPDSFIIVVHDFCVLIRLEAACVYKFLGLSRHVTLHLHLSMCDSCCHIEVLTVLLN